MICRKTSTPKFSAKRALLLTTTLSALALSGCSPSAEPGTPAPKAEMVAAQTDAEMSTQKDGPIGEEYADVNPEFWPTVETAPLDPEVEARVDAILAKMTVEQKVGQVIQGDSANVTPEDVKKYRLGSVLSGGNSAPGPLPYATTSEWLKAADDYYEASIDPDGVDIAVPIIWGIDAVHGHANLRGATIFPHNIGLGAARNPDLIEEIMEVTARELIVSGHDWTFAPTLAVPQNDRWGRAYEGFSEDPEIVASYGGRIVDGLQGRQGTDEYMDSSRVMASAKHFVGDGGTKDGIDQGDAQISEEELRDIHMAGYIPAIESGAQSVMASFSAWQGLRMHGAEELLTDVLKDRMNFTGFVIGDWNGHRLIPGCTSTDCPDSFNAGVDMYMAPDSWKGLYESTLTHVQSGRISQERLDDAVRRILRAKVQSGIFDKPKPSERLYAGDTSLLASPEHKAVARQAVRESLVLLKNKDGLLPLEKSQTVLVVGDGADSITKAAGGWTLSWQGGGYPNSEFPQGESILSGIRSVVEAAGGTVIHDATGTGDHQADVIIAVYGEDPYAEFQGDVEHLDFSPNSFDTSLLPELGADGTPIVSVFLSGRPLWTNPEINASSAFVAAWLPGTEGGGIADILFQTDPTFDFTGRLSFSWPKLATQVKLNPHHDGYNPLFPLGYGLSYSSEDTIGLLSEESGLTEDSGSDKGVMFAKGAANFPWQLLVGGRSVEQLPVTDGDVTIAALDRAAQEDALAVSWIEGEAAFALVSSYGIDFSRESNGAMELTFMAKSLTGDGELNVGMGCDGGDEACQAYLPLTIDEDWQTYRLSMSCFASRGVDMVTLQEGLLLQGSAGQSVGISDVMIQADTDGKENCGTE